MRNEHIFKVIILYTVLLLQSCASSYKYSYEEENSPLFEGDYRMKTLKSDAVSNPSIKVVSFNIEFARNIEEAITLLQKEPLYSADVILLQEMDEEGTERLAKNLHMSYVYYPAIYHPKHEKNVGNAILSKWEIKDSQKIKLPHPSTYPVLLEGKNYIFRKTATLANIEIGEESITFVSTHAAAFNTTQKRKEFAEAIAAQLQDTKVRHVVVGGDFNSLGSADIAATVRPFTSSNFLWASEFIGMTVSEKKSILRVVPEEAFQLDHLFVRGMCINDAGKVNQKGISDHLPIWIDIEVEIEDTSKTNAMTDSIFKLDTETPPACSWWVQQFD